jgi:transcriptional regulator with XRE-family HTH domain
MTKPEHPLRTWRQSHKPRKTLSEVAGKVGVTPSHLSEVENWKNEPSLGLTAELCKITGIDMKAFVKQAESA